MKVLDQYPKEVKVFLVASLINATGSALMWPLVSMFVFDELGRSMSDAGLVILVQAVGGIIGQLLGGALYHKVGVKRLIVGALGMNALGLFMLPVVSHSWYAFMAMMALIGLFNALSMPAIQSFIGFRFAKKRVELFNVIYVANNIGVAIGTALSGFLADVSYSLSFVLNGVTSAVFAVFFLLYLKKIDDETTTKHTVASAHSVTPGASHWLLMRNYRLYLYMALAALLLHLGNSLWNTGVSPYIISVGMPKSSYGFLWTLNGILIFAAQPVISLIKRFIAKSLSAQMIVSSFFYAGGYIVILALHSYPGMVFAMVLITFGEMLISPVMPAYLSEHGGKNAPFYIGLTGGIGSAGRVVGPFLMGTLYDNGGLIPVAWLAMGTALLSAGFYLIHSRVNRSSIAEAYS
ncbi:MAG: MFS transporter [Gorillibacterium sp.]|nr:MFS transporter [Gorillibacterium sp.]